MELALQAIFRRYEVLDFGDQVLVEAQLGAILLNVVHVIVDL